MRMAQSDPQPTIETKTDPNWIDREKSKDLDAIYVNRFFVEDLGSSMVRVSVGEYINGEPQYRVALAMTAIHALQFAELLARIAYPLVVPPAQTGVPTPEEPSRGPPNG